MAVPHDTGGLTWNLEPSHFPSSPTRWTAELFLTIQNDAIKRVTAEGGLPVDGLAMREFDGHVYTTVVPLGGKARKPPPAALVPLLCKVVPELRRRVAASNRWVREDRPTQIIDEWFGGKEAALLDQGRMFFRLDLENYSGPKLAHTIEEAIAYAADALFWHFSLHGAAVWQIGVLGMQLEADHGWTDTEYAALFTGLSSTSTGPAEAQRALRDMIEAQGATETLARAASLEELRKLSAPLRDAIDDYLDSWGLRAIRYEVAYPMVSEHPEWLLRQLQEQARGDTEDHAEAHAAARAAAEQRLFDDLGDTDETRKRLETARRTFPVREGNETATVGLPVAVLRHLGLVAGHRLSRVGNLERREDVFDLTIEEVTAVLRQAPNAPADPALRARTRREARLAADRTPAPRTIGPPPKAAGPPSLKGFPAAIVEGTQAMLWYADKVFGAPPPVSEAEAAGNEIRGIAVSPGRYEGTARVLLDESDLDRIHQGDVLVCPITSPVWSMVFPALGALVCDAGGPLSHPAIIAREFGIPAVVGTGVATAVIPNGTPVVVDGDAGTVALRAARA
jgi:pyruvate,water dikinase